MMLLHGTYCNALLLAHWSVRQKLNHVSSVQLRRSVLTQACNYSLTEKIKLRSRNK